LLPEYAHDPVYIFSKTCITPRKAPLEQVKAEIECPASRGEVSPLERAVGAGKTPPNIREYQ